MNLQASTGRRIPSLFLVKKEREKLFLSIHTMRLRCRIFRSQGRLSRLCYGGYPRKHGWSLSRWSGTLWRPSQSHIWNNEVGDVGRPVGTILNKPVSSTGFAEFYMGGSDACSGDVGFDFATPIYKAIANRRLDPTLMKNPSLYKLGRRPQCGTDFLTPMVEVKFNSAV